MCSCDTWTMVKVTDGGMNNKVKESFLSLEVNQKNSVGKEKNKGNKKKRKENKERKKKKKRKEKRKGKTKRRESA